MRIPPEVSGIVVMDAGERVGGKEQLSEGSAAKAGRPMFSGEMKKTFEKAAGREEAAFGMA